MHRNPDSRPEPEYRFDGNNSRAAARPLVDTMNGHSVATAQYRETMRESLHSGKGLSKANRRLTGSVTANRTSRAAAQAIDARPTLSERAWMLAGEHLAHDLLQVGVPDDLAAQAVAFATWVEPAKDAFRGHGLDRRGAVTLEAAARHLIHHTQPVNLTFAGADRIHAWRLEQWDLLEGLPGDHHPDLATEVEHQGLKRLFWRPRVMWAHSDGIAAGLLVDRFHHTSLRGLISRDTWVHRKVAEDLTSVAALLRHHLPEVPPAVLGVRVISPRRPNSSLHFPAVVGDRPNTARVTVGRPHALGGCEFCKPANRLPNQQAAAVESTTAGASA